VDNTLLMILLFTIAPVSTLVLGYVIGNNQHLVRQAIESIQFWIKEREAEDAEGSAVVESPPKLIRERDRQGKLDTDESQVVTIKSPQQIRADKDRKLNEELDRLGR
jgi:hypothetical protein